MKSYLILFAVAILVGAFYAGIGVRSPAPPLVALLGLLGFLIGEKGVPMVRESLGLGHVSKNSIE